MTTVKSEASKHTPGPWEVAFSGDFDAETNGALAIVRAVCGGLMIHVDSREQWRDPRPDARLIAAAPELLEALESVSRMRCSTLTDSNKVKVYEQVEAAISKAKGEL